MKSQQAKLATTEKSYKSLGITEGLPEIWEDGMRTSGSKGTYEWWYFDCHLDDGTTVVVGFYTKTILNIQRDIIPLVKVDIDYPDGRSIHEAFEGNADHFSSSKEQCNVVIGDNYFRGDLKNYEIHFSNKNLTLDIKLVKQSESWRPKTGVIYFGDAEQDYFAWVVPVPYGSVEATIIDNGQKLVLHGNGYHDHNWGNKLLPALIHHWYWARIKVGDYVIIAADIVAEKNFEYTNIPIIMIAKNGKVVADESEKVLLLKSVAKINAITKKPYCDILQFIYQDGNTQYTITLHRDKDIIDEPLVTRIESHFKRMVAEFLKKDAAYHRFIGKVQIEKRVGNEIVESLSSEDAVWELMYFGEGRTP